MSVPTLHTARLDLVPLDVDRDAAGLHVMLGDRELNEFGPTAPAADIDETRRLLARQLDPSGRTWVLHERGSREPLGTVGLFAGQGPPICGLSWALRRDRWGQGLMGEAVTVVVEHLLAQPGIDGLEAWIDSRNRRSLGVARRAGMAESGRLPRVYDDGELAQSVIMTRSAVPADLEVLAIFPRLLVRDVRATAEHLAAVFGLHLAFIAAEPPAEPSMARLKVTSWSGSPGIDVLAAAGTVAPAQVCLDVAVLADVIAERARARGLAIVQPPTDQPYFRRTCTVALPDGHHIVAAGPLPR